MASSAKLNLPDWLSVEPRVFKNATYRFIPPTYHKRAESKPPRLEVCIPLQSIGSFLISEESQWDRFMKAFGMAEIQTLDQDFDRKIFISSVSSPSLRSFLQNSDKKNSILNLIRNEFKEIEHDGKTLKATYFPYRESDQSQGFSVVEKAVEDLSSLGYGLENSLSEDRPLHHQLHRSLERFGQAAASVALVLSIFPVIFSAAFFPVFDTWSLISRGISVGSTAWLVAFFLILQVLRSSSYRAKTVLLIFISLFVSLNALSVSAGFYLNQQWDVSKAVRHEAKVVSKYSRRNKKSTSYFVEVQSWRKNASPTESIRVSHDFYNKAEAGSDWLEIETRSGYFGFEWESRLQFLDSKKENLNLFGEDLLSRAYKDTNVNRQKFDPFKSSASDDEKNYLSELFALTDHAVILRVTTIENLLYGKSVGSPPKTFSEVIRALSDLRPPSRLREVHDLVVEAVEAEQKYLEEWQDAKKAGQTFHHLYEKGQSLAPAIQELSAKLRKAHSILLSLYPDEPEQNRQSFYAHLCALDMI